MRTIITSLILLTTLQVELFATASEPDYVIINSDTLAMFSSPLNDYFIQNNIDTDSLFKDFGSTTACFDRHYAIWEIEDSSLYLKEIINCAYDFWEDIETDDEMILFNQKKLVRDLDLSIIFGKKFKNGRVKAEWCNRLLKIVDSKLMHYVNFGSYSLYEKEIIIEVRNGQIVNYTEYSNKDIEMPSGYKVEDLRNYIVFLPEYLEHCYFLNKSDQLIDTTCYCDEQETISLIGGLEFFSEQMNEKNQINRNKILIDSLMHKYNKFYTFSNSISANRKWYNISWVDGINESDKIRIFVISNYSSQNWFKLSVKNKTQSEFLTMCDNILNKLILCGL